MWVFYGNILKNNLNNFVEGRKNVIAEPFLYIHANRATTQSLWTELTYSNCTLLNLPKHVKGIQVSSYFDEVYAFHYKKMQKIYKNSRCNFNLQGHESP